MLGHVNPDSSRLLARHEGGKVPQQGVFLQCKLSSPVKRVQVVGTIMPEWLQEQITASKKLRQEQIDETKCRKMIEFTQKQLEELEKSDMVTGKSFKE